MVLDLFVICYLVFLMCLKVLNLVFEDGGFLYLVIGGDLLWSVIW